MHALAPDVRFTEVTLPTGIRLRCAEHGARGGAPVLFLHGYSDSWFSFSPVLPLLPSGLRCLVPDQRGHGESERPAGGYGVDAFADDAAGLLDALGIQRAAVVGHSMGSLVAQRLAARHPERVDRLVLAGSATRGDVDSIRELHEVVRELDDPVPVDFVREFQRGTAHGPLDAAFLDAVVAESMRLPAPVWRETLDGILGTNNRRHLGDVQAPTLILWGERDQVFGRDEQDRLFDDVPHATLTVYGDTGHALHWERPLRFARDLEAFLAPAPAGV